MTTPRTSLGILLIISAIDLLICSFTAGVTLFLIFQPSLRTDVRSGVSNSISENGTISNKALSPVVVIIRSINDNQTKSTFEPPDFKFVEERSLRPLHVLISTVPNHSSFSFWSDGPWYFRVSVLSQGRFKQVSVECSSKLKKLTIDPAEELPIKFVCG